MALGLELELPRLAPPIHYHILRGIFARRDVIIRRLRDLEKQRIDLRLQFLHSRFWLLHAGLQFAHAGDGRLFLGRIFDLADLLRRLVLLGPDLLKFPLRRQPLFIGLEQRIYVHLDALELRTLAVFLRILT